jgi:hypothetical protein
VGKIGQDRARKDKSGQREKERVREKRGILGRNKSDVVGGSGEVGGGK